MYCVLMCSVKQLANNQLTQGYTPIDTEKFMACLEEGVISVCFLLGDESPRYDLQVPLSGGGLILLLLFS